MSRTHLVHVTSIILIALAVAMAATTMVSALLGAGDTVAFMASTLITAAVGWLGFRHSSLQRDLTIREGYAVVSVSWIAIGLAGALPYLFSGAIRSPASALFESVSGFTTTGATVFSQIEGLPEGVLFWRALTQWIGGMGIIVLGIAVLPFLGVGGMQLFRAEVPGPTPERLAPRIAQTAKLLWYVYAGLTALQTMLYLLGGMSFFDALTHAFTTLSTGGFSVRNASLAAYDSAYIQYVTIVFMFLAGANFTLHYRAVTGKPARYLTDAEWRAYTAILLTATVVIVPPLLLSGQYSELGFERAIRDALFQTASIGTTTGYVNYNYELWPASTNLVLLLLMFIGGMAGSTAGGMKVIRVYAFARQGVTALKRSLHPRAVMITRIGRKPIRETDLLTILAFILLYLVLFFFGALALTLLGNDFVTSIGASAASLGNVGPGLGAVGAIDNYGWMGPVSKLVLVFLMLVGRLEIFTLLVLFHPDLWRKTG